MQDTLSLENSMRSIVPGSFYHIFVVLTPLTASTHSDQPWNWSLFLTRITYIYL